MAACVIVIVLWQGLSLVFSSYWLPAPWSVASRLVNDLVNGDMLIHMLYTSAESILGFCLGGIPAVTLPFLLRRRPGLTAVIDPFMTIGYTVPKLVLAPLLLLWFGIGIGSKVAAVALSTFFIVYFNAHAGVHDVDPKLTQLAKIVGATESHIARYVVLPGAAPHILVGVRLALPYSIGSAVLAELLSANRGLGYVIQFSATAFDTTGVFAALVALGVIVFVSNAAVAGSERRLRRCRPPSLRDALLEANQ
jgi:NitT/TauT family transport system permease protein